MVRTYQRLQLVITMEVEALLKIRRILISVWERHHLQELAVLEYSIIVASVMPILLNFLILYINEIQEYQIKVGEGADHFHQDMILIPGHLTWLCEMLDPQLQ